MSDLSGWMGGTGRLQHRVVRGVLASAALALAAPAQAQELVPEELACETCEIRPTPSLEFSSPSFLSGSPTHVTAHGQDYVVLIPGELPLVFTSEGEFVRELGRSGEGPGEFRSAAYATALPGDSLLVVDSRLRRVSVFAPDLEFVRTISLPIAGRSVGVLRWPDRVVVNGSSNTPEGAGWPLHLLDLTDSPARELASFGDTDGELRPGGMADLLRTVFDVGREGIWTAHAASFQFARYSDEGEQLWALRRQPEWFSEPSEANIGSPTQPPPPFVQDAAVHDDLLWVGLRVPHPDWQAAWQGTIVPPSGELTAPEAPDRTELYMTRIEVIDLDRLELLAALSLEGLVVQVRQGLEMILYDLEDGLHPRLRAFDLHLEGRGGT